MAYLRSKKLIIEPNQQYEFPLRGNSVKVVDADCKIYFKTSDGEIDFYLEKGETANFDQLTFLNLIVYHLESFDKSIVIAIGDNAKITSSRVAGEVSVINGGIKEVLSQNSFIGGVGFNGVALNNSHIQLLNPSITKRISVSSIIISSTTAGIVNFGAINTPLTNFVSNGNNKLIGGVSSIGELRSVANVGLIAGGYYGSINLLNTQRIDFERPIVVDSNKGLYLAHTVVAANLYASFQWSEVDI